MIFNLKGRKEYSYLKKGKGEPMVLLHGLMGDLSNFTQQVDYFSAKYEVYSLCLPLYTLPILKTNLVGLTNYVSSFLTEVVKEPAILVGNSLGGHIALMVALRKNKLVKYIVLTASSGLYEHSFGESYPKRGSYEYVKNKTEEVFYDPDVATKEMVDNIFNTLSDRSKTLKTIYLSRSAQKHNMTKDLKNIKQPCCLIWGNQDKITPVSVGKEFNQLLVNSELFLIDKCGHSPMMEHPDTFNTILDSWLEKQKVK